MNIKIKYKDNENIVRGLFAEEFIHKGSIILVLNGNYFPEATRTSIRVRDKNVEHYEGGFLNHHCNPNAKILEIEDVEEAVVVARKHIYRGEEITFDYETTEPILAAPFKCECHGNWIRGKDYYDTYAIGQMMDEGGMDYSGAFESDIEE